MSALFRILAAAAIAFTTTLLVVPSDCMAQATTLFATKIFSDAAGEEHGLAYDAAANRLYTVERATTLVAPQLRAYALDGTLVSGPHALSATTGALTRMGLHFIRAATSIGGQAVSAGSLIYLRDATLYVLDKTDGSVTASEVVDPDFDTGGLCTSPLAGGGKGLGYSTALGRFMSTNSCCNCSGVAEFIGGQVTGFIATPVPGTAGSGGVKEQPGSGNIWVGSSPSIASLSVFSQQRALIAEYNVVDADTLGPVGVMRLAFDATGDTLWLLSSANGDIYQADVSSLPEPVPTLGAWGLLLLVLALGVGALRFARRERVQPA
jgi:hypothetical protein